jgi:hypothetical protein
VVAVMVDPARFEVIAAMFLFVIRLCGSKTLL